MDSIEILKVTSKEIEELQTLGRQTFYETFADGNTKENMERYLSEGFNIDKLMSELENPFSQFYFAKLDKKAIGYLKINFDNAQTELNDSKALEIERIYVIKEFHGKQVGQLLYDKALEIAKQKGLNFMWLGVWEENPRAINFYKKNGFIEFDKHIFKLGNDEQTDIMMKLKI